MFDTGRLNDEWQAMMVDVAQLLSRAGAQTVDAAKDGTAALAEQIKAALAELGETLSEEEEQLRGLVTERPVASLASAFALGVAVGFMLRRH